MERSGTLGISYQLRSALKERHRLPAKSGPLPLSLSAAPSEHITWLAPSVEGKELTVPGKLDVFVLLPRVPLRFTLAEFFNRFAVNPTGPRAPDANPKSEI